MLLAIVVLSALVLEGVGESLLWRETLWGSHFYGFFPRLVLLAAPLALIALGVTADRWFRVQRGLPTAVAESVTRPSPHARDRDSRPAIRGRWNHWLPWIAGSGAGAIFWLARERHLFWGDGLPLSINLPQGQRFHPDEPLTIYLHHLFFRLGGGHWSAATAVAFASALSGAVFAGWTVHWFGTRYSDRLLVACAVAVVLTQGFVQIFFGHVENYAYLAVCLLFFFTLGVDFLEGRRGPIPALLAATLGFAFHILGALAFVPAAILVFEGLRRPRSRAATCFGVAAAFALVAIGARLASHEYGVDGPLRRLGDGVLRVLTQPTDTRVENLFSWRHLGDVWSEFMLLGPLSLPLLAALFVLLPGTRMTRTAAGLFLVTGAVVCFAPSLITGAGNLGAARNWDLFAAPSIVVVLCGLILIADHVGPRQARGLLIALVTVSLFHTVPWIALNTNFDRTVQRVAALPLGNGRGETMLGTHYLNAGDLPRAERWFRAAAADAPDNVNAQSGLGVALARQGHLPSALDPMTNAVRLKPESTQYRLDLIHLLLALERWQPAAAQLEDLLVMNPHDRSAWFMLAQCRLRLGRPDVAFDGLATALQLFPGDAEIQSALAETCARRIERYSQLGQWAEARKAVIEFEAYCPGHPAVAALRARIPAVSR